MMLGIWRFGFEGRWMVIPGKSMVQGYFMISSSAFSWLVI